MGGGIDRTGAGFSSLDAAGQRESRLASEFSRFAREARSSTQDTPLLMAQALPQPDPGAGGKPAPGPQPAPWQINPSRPPAKILPFPNSSPSVTAAEGVGARAAKILGPLRMGSALALPLMLSGDTPLVRRFDVAGRDNFTAEDHRETGIFSVIKKNAWYLPNDVLAELKPQWSQGGRGTVLGADGQAIGTIENGKVIFTPEALAALDERAHEITMGRKRGAEDVPATGAAQDPAAVAQPQPKEEEKKCEKAEGAAATGPAIPPTPADVARLVAEHSQDKSSPPLTPAAAWSIVAQTQPPGTRAEIPGQNAEGPDIYYKDDCSSVRDTVQVKSVEEFNGFNKALSEEVNKKPEYQSRVIAFQADPARLDPKDARIDKWLGRYWGNRIKKDPDGWML